LGRRAVATCIEWSVELGAMHGVDKLGPKQSERVVL
jgi:hypothetical protein